jgi:hypothetical protein
MAMLSKPTKPPYRRPATSPFANQVDAPPRRFQVGDRVHSDANGLGRVTAVEENPGAVIVDFGTTTQRIASPYPRLTKL